MSETVAFEVSHPAPIGAQTHPVARLPASTDKPPQPGFLARTQALFEAVWEFNARRGVAMPMQGAATKHKINVYISGTGLPKHPDGFAFGGESILMHPNALGPGSSVVGHEFTHVLQFYSGGFRDSELVGWFWECHANWNSHQFNPGYAPALEVLAAGLTKRVAIADP